MISHCMPDLLIRNLNPQLHDTLKERARSHAQSVSAEVKAILSRALGSEEAGEERIGTRMVELFQKAGPFELEIDRSEKVGEPPDLS